MLQFTRDCLCLRNTHPALRDGSMKILEAGAQRLIFERTSGEALRCTFNLSDRKLPFSPAGKPLMIAGTVRSDTLDPYSAIVETV